MSAPQNIAEAILAHSLVNAAWDIWAKQAHNSDDEEDGAWQAGYEAFEVANSNASDAVIAMRCASLPEVAAKLGWLRDETAGSFDSPQHKRLADLHEDLSRLIDRPTQDAFAVKMRAYQRAAQDCQEAQAAKLDDDTMRPLYGAVHDCGKAVLLEPAPDVAALIEKRRIFDALQYQDDDEAPAVAHRLFADAIALAGSAA